MYQELTLLPHNTVIQDYTDNVLIIFGIDRGRFWWDTPREKDRIVFMSPLETTGVDFGVDLVLIW